MPSPAEILLKPLTIKRLALRNRVMSTSHAPGCGSSSVVVDSPAASGNQIPVAGGSVIPVFREFSDRVHRHGAALMIRLTHMERRTCWAPRTGCPSSRPRPGASRRTATHPTVGAPGSAGALDRLRAATEATAQGRLLVGPSPDEAARVIHECLQEQGVLPR